MGTLLEAALRSPAREEAVIRHSRAGVLQGLLSRLPEEVDVVALSGTSGGAMCAALAWDGLVRGDAQLACQKLQKFWEAIAANEPLDKIINQTMLTLGSLRNHMVLARGQPLPPADMGRAAVPRHPQSALRFRGAAEAGPASRCSGAAHRCGRGTHRSLRGFQGRRAAGSSACWPPRRSPSSSGRSRSLAGACTGTGSSLRTRRSTISRSTISTSFGSSRSTRAPVPGCRRRPTRSPIAATNWPVTFRWSRN